MSHLTAAHDRRTPPPPLTPLIGRERELAVLRQFLSDNVRLLTLTGPAGVGKTSLALALAAVAGEDFPDGIWFVDLAPLHDPGAVPAAIAQVLGLGGDRALTDNGRHGGDDPAHWLRRYLRSRRLLLILDNFEHLLPAAGFVADLVGTAPAVTIVVASRERLHLRSEQVFVVPPLALPDLDRLPPLAVLAAVPAVALFLRRARAVMPDLSLTADNAPAIAAICRHLDGLPLAIELAAARANLLAPAALLAHLEPRLPLLRWSARDMPARHHTLAAAIAWSDALLPHKERTLFHRLGIFTGGFTLEGVEKVALRSGGGAGAPPPTPSPLDLLGSLVDKSLLTVGDPVGAEPRFGMLETIREYALEQLRASGTLEAARRAHAAYFLALAERAQPELTGPAQADWILLLEREHANLLAALDWLAVQDAGDAELRLAVALRRFWRSRGYPREGLRRVEGALARAPEAGPTLRTLALDSGGYFALQLGAEEQAAARLGEALELARALGDEQHVALVLNNLGVLATRQGHAARATALLEEALRINRRLGDDWSTALTLYKLAVLGEAQGAAQRASRLLRESLTLFRALGDRRSVAVVLTALAVHAENARELLAEGLALCRELRDRGTTAYALILTLDVVAGHVSPECLARLLGAVDGLCEAMAINLSRTTTAHRQRAEALARAALDESAYATAWDAGHALPLETVIDDALAALSTAAPAGQARTRAPSERLGDPLTRREREVLGLLANGLSNREIAGDLSIGERTARFHVTAILGKLGVRTRGQAVAVAVRRGLL